MCAGTPHGRGALARLQELVVFEVTALRPRNRRSTDGRDLVVTVGFPELPERDSGVLKAQSGLLKGDFVADSDQDKVRMIELSIGRNEAVAASLNRSVCRLDDLLRVEKVFADKAVHVLRRVNLRETGHDNLHR
jgi:hypothetical protein